MISCFMYHDVRDSKSFNKRYDLKSFLSVKKFREHIDFINKNYKIIKSSEIPYYINDNIECAVITFDDGLKDHFNITDILLEYKITGTFLIPKVPVTEGKMIHSHKIQFIIASEGEYLIRNRILSYINSKERDSVYESFSISRVKDNWWSKDMIFITNFLRYHTLGKKITNELFETLVSSDEKSFCDDFYLTENDIVDMVNSGMEIGSHGLTSDILNDENAYTEISESMKFIQKFYNKNKIFSYPNGIFNEKCIEILKSENCEFAFTTASEKVNSETDFLKIPRFDGTQKIII